MSPDSSNAPEGAQNETDLLSGSEVPFNPEVLTPAEIEEVLSLCEASREEYGKMQEKGRKRPSERQRSGYKVLNGGTGMESSKQTERRVIAVHEFRTKVARRLHQSTIRAIVTRLKEDTDEIIEQFAPNGHYTECYYPVEFAQKVRTALLELMSRDLPAGYKRWGKEASSPEEVPLGATRAIARFLQQKGCGEFTEVIDEKGDLAGYCSAETLRHFEAVWNQIKTLPDYVEVSLFVNDINKERKKRQQIDLAEVLALAKQFAADDSGEVRPVFHLKCGVTTTISTNLALRLKQHFAGQPDRVKKWLNIRQIMRLYRVGHSSGSVSQWFKDAAEPDVEVQVFRDGESPRVNYYSEALVEQIMAERGYERVNPRF